MEGRSMTSKKNGMRAVGSLVALMVVLSGMLVLFAGAASAAEEINCELDPYNSVCKKEEDKNFNPDVDADVLTRPETPDEPGETLPFTGADVALFVITGAALVATGMLVVRRTRSSRSEA
ncbi:MAG: hypothetical protein M3198_03245 [Actinomycetota bacterium]|nr:hypothetical protein [Actinomycetota bacterium]